MEENFKDNKTFVLESEGVSDGHTLNYREVEILKIYIASYFQ